MLLSVSVCIPPIIARQWLGKNPPIVARQWLGRNVTAVTNTHATIEELLDAPFLMCLLQNFFQILSTKLHRVLTSMQW
jgi:hypothetical protein